LLLAFETIVLVLLFL